MSVCLLWYPPLGRAKRAAQGSNENHTIQWSVQKLRMPEWVNSLCRSMLFYNTTLRLELSAVISYRTLASNVEARMLWESQRPNQRCNEHHTIWWSAQSEADVRVSMAPASTSCMQKRLVLKVVLECKHVTTALYVFSDIPHLHHRVL